MTSERDTQAKILLALSHGPTRLLRINAGVAWQGDVIEHTREILVLARPYAIRLAAPGVSDLIGWAEGGRFVAIEVKASRGRLTAEQAAFLDLVRRSGGLAGVARNVEEARAIIDDKP
ncbi:MAG TPA: VRR-NUC domain-containing protein [Steroidobacteraceae bacterium]|nr:VRR-NUC domain-containing protein [Steroidobacteraceae bacterium]